MDHEEGDAAIANECLDVIRTVIAHGHRDRLIATGCELLMNLDQIGHLLDAGNAAGRPEINQIGTTTKLLGAHRLT